MAWLAVDKDGSEYIYENRPIRISNAFDGISGFDNEFFELPKGSIKKLIGRELTWNDEPVEFK